MQVIEVTKQFDEFLKERNLSLEAVVIGGAALVLLGVISRQTKDCDVLHPLLTPELEAAAREFALAMRQSGIALQDNWLNHEPSSIAGLLPVHWESRVQLVFKGETITFYTLGRLDLLRTKLFALCDRGSDMQDCIAMNPTFDEIQEASPWVQMQDANPDWPRHVVSVLRDLASRL